MIPVGLMFGYTIPEFWLGGRVKKRQKAHPAQIPDALDLLTISVRAGLGFDGALGKVVEKLKGPLTDEFRRALAEIRVGKPRRDALRDIVPRTEVPALTNFIGAIIQAEQLGVSISKVLQVQSEQLRIERRQRAEEMAAKAPIKMLFPLVGCIFPSLFIVILGPGDHPDHDQPGQAARRLRPGYRPWRAGGAAASRATSTGHGPRRAAGDGRLALGQVHGPDGPSLAARGGRPVAAREQRDPHDVHALPDRCRVRVQPRRRRVPRGRSVHRGLRAWTGLVPLVRGADGVLELPVGTIDATGTAVAIGWRSTRGGSSRVADDAWRLCP